MSWIEPKPYGQSRVEAARIEIQTPPDDNEWRPMPIHEVLNALNRMIDREHYAAFRVAAKESKARHSGTAELYESIRYYIERKNKL